MIAGHRRVAGFAALVLVCVTAGTAYVAHAAGRNRSPAATASGVAPDLGPTLAAPHVLFRSTAGDAHYGRLEVVPLDGVAGGRAVTDLDCDRVAAGGDRTLCLQADRGVITTYRAVILDAGLETLATLPLEGLPSRARVSAGGRWAASTTFTSGDSYSAATFSTRTVIYDLRTATAFGNLEQFRVTRDGHRFEAVDFNFWGVTYAADENTFYATLASGGKTYLVRGDLAGRSAAVLREGVECPSLSPDGTRLAFKQRSGGLGPVQWRPAVLDLATLEDHPLAETRSVDDQIEWLDDATVLYRMPESPSGSAVVNTWVIPADGSGRPSLFLPKAESAVIVGRVATS
jgi:hypothetical protein